MPTWAKCALHSESGSGRSAAHLCSKLDFQLSTPKGSTPSGGCWKKRRPTALSEARMVTAGMVNGLPRYFSPPYFCVFFRDSGRFLDSWNPVNYLFVTAVSLAKGFAKRMERFRRRFRLGLTAHWRGSCGAPSVGGLEIVRSKHIASFRNNAPAANLM